MGSLYYWVANWNLSRAGAAGRLGGNVVDMIDCLHGSVAEVARAFPTVRAFAGYVTGTPDIRWTAEDFARLRTAGAIVLEIDQSNADLPILADVRVCGDVEPGAKTAAVAAEIAGQRLARGDNYTIYCDESELAAVEHAIAARGLPAGRIVAYQYASPTSNPDLRIPGLVGGTLRSVNADLSVAVPGWVFGAHTPPPGPSGTFQARLAVTDHGEWSVHGTPAPVVLGGPPDWWEAKVAVQRATGSWRISPLPAEPR